MYLQFTGKTSKPEPISRSGSFEFAWNHSLILLKPFNTWIFGPLVMSTSHCELPTGGIRALQCHWCPEHGDTSSLCCKPTPPAPLQCPAEGQPAQQTFPTLPLGRLSPTGLTYCLTYAEAELLMGLANPPPV